jgi:AsmA family protein
MKRSVKILLGAVAVILALSVIAFIVIANFDWNRAKPWVVEKVGHAVGRTVSIDGDLRVTWQRDPLLHGWRSWVPGPHVSAAKVTVGNADWGKQGEFATADSVEFDLAVLPLFAHTLSIPSVQFVAPSTHLERLADGRNNWTFAADSGNASSPWRFDLGRVKFNTGKFTVNDRQNDLDLQGSVEVLQKTLAFDEQVTQQERSARHEAAARIGENGAKQFGARAQQHVAPASHKQGEPQRYAFSWTAAGRLRGAAIKGSGRIGSELELKHADEPFPMQAEITFGDTRVDLVGTLTDPSDLNGLDLRLWLSGSNLAQIYDIFRVTLPDSPPYATEGRLVGSFTGDEKKLRYEDFTARVGDSDLGGDLVYQIRSPRSQLTGKIQSDLLQFRDLAPLIGADPGGIKGAAKAPDAAGKLLPEEPFRPERWRAMDADVEFTGDRVFRDAQLPIHKMQARIVMDDGVLTLKPMRFNYARGDVDASMRFDGQSAPIKGKMQLTARGMQLNHILPAVEALKATLGQANGEVTLTGTGNSVGALLGAADGEVKLLLNDGTISKALLETAGLNLPNIVATKIFGDKQVAIDCAAADLVATGGVYNAQLFVIDTDVARIDVTGNLDLGKEKLDLTAHPDSKNLRFLSLRSPIHVRGTFSDPDISIDKGVLLARGAGAIGLAIVATPIAALLPLTATSNGDTSNPCATLLQGMQQVAAKPAPKGKR